MLFAFINAYYRMHSSVTLFVKIAYIRPSDKADNQSKKIDFFQLDNVFNIGINKHLYDRKSEIFLFFNFGSSYSDCSLPGFNQQKTISDSLLPIINN